MSAAAQPTDPAPAGALPGSLLLAAGAIALLPYGLFSLLGYGVYDHGAILLSSRAVAAGEVPYSDFHWIVTPLTLYLQAGLQRALPFLAPMLVSAWWKGLSFVFLAGVFVRYLEAWSRGGGRLRVPRRAALAIPTVLMCAGPIHETHLGYTPDAIVCGCLAVLCLTWPGRSGDGPELASRMSLLGAFLAGATIAFKQEIGAWVAGFAALLLLVRAAGVVVEGGGAAAGRCGLRLAGNLLCLLLVPACVVAGMAAAGALGPMLQSIVEVPLSIKASTRSLLVNFATFSSPAAWFLLAALVVAGLLAGASRSSSGTAAALLRRRDGIAAPALATAALALATAFLAWVMLTTPNAVVERHFSLPAAPGALDRDLVYVVYAAGFRTAVFALLGVLLHDAAVALRRRETPGGGRWGLVAPMTGLLGLLSSAGLAGYGIGHPVRGPRIVVPLLLAGMLVLFRNEVPWRRAVERWRVPLRAAAVCFLAFFLAGRIGGVFSVVLADPLHRPIAFVRQLGTFVDREHAEELRAIRDFLGARPGNLFVYLADPMVYVYLDREPPTRTPVHFSDWYPSALDGAEIERLEAGVSTVVTHATYERKAGFATRAEDPIRDYIEANFEVALPGRGLIVWTRKAHR